MSKQRPILVIEDSDHDFAVLEMCLKTAAVSNRLDRCATGQEIAAYLARMETTVVASIPVFVFLDLNVPGARGHDVLEQLKAHPALAAVPVVVLTTSTQARDIDLAYESGAAGFLTKPLDLDKFETMIQQVTDYWFAAVKLPQNLG